MSKLNDPVEALANAVREAELPPADHAAIARARRRLLEARPASRPVRARVAALAFAAVALAIALFALRPSAPAASEPLAFSVGSPPVAGELGEFLAQAGSAPVPVRFSEGSQVDLDPGTRARVTETTPRGASVVLERGTLQARITKSEAPRDWKFHAGPFRIDVTGTEFVAAWNPETEELSVQLHEGSLRVHGPLVSGRDVRAGERLSVSLKDQRAVLALGPDRVESVAVAHVDPVADDRKDAASDPASEPKPPSPAPSARVARVRAPSEARPTPEATGWRELHAQGRHGDAMKALDDARFQALVGSASAGELRQLVDAARLGGRSDRAYAALIAQRERFGARGESAFLLGRIAMDQRRNAGEANRWFSAYLQESPNGPFAEQALGRMLELGAKGKPEHARQLAERYLARFPTGAHARLARSLLEP